MFNLNSLPANDQARRLTAVSVAACLLVLLVSVTAFPQTTKPLAKKNLIAALKLGLYPTKTLVRQVEQRGVDFQLSGEAEAELREAGAYPELIEAVRRNYRATLPLDDEGFKKAGLSYDDLLDQAVEALAEKNGGKAIDLLQQAVESAPTRPTAYSLLGFIRIHMRQMIKGRDRKAEREAGERNMREALDRDGEALFPVSHIHPSLVTACGGVLIVRRASVAYIPLLIYIKSADDSFDVSDANIWDVQPGLGAISGGDRFFITVVRADGKEKNYLFAVKKLDAFSNRYPKFIQNLIEDYK